MLTFLCYPKCSTCQKAKKWLDDRGISYQLRDIKPENPTAEELARWHSKSGLPLDGVRDAIAGIRDIF